MTHLASFDDAKALRVAKAIRELRAKWSSASTTVANYHDPDDYRTPMFAEALLAASEKLANVEAALAALEEALS